MDKYKILIALQRKKVAFLKIVRFFIETRILQIPWPSNRKSTKGGSPRLISSSIFSTFLYGAKNWRNWTTSVAAKILTIFTHMSQNIYLLVFNRVCCSCIIRKKFKIQIKNWKWICQLSRHVQNTPWDFLENQFLRSNVCMKWKLTPCWVRITLEKLAICFVKT